MILGFHPEDAISQGLVLEKKRLFGSKVVVAERVNIDGADFLGRGSFVVLHSMQTSVVSHGRLRKKRRKSRENIERRWKASGSGGGRVKKFEDGVLVAEN